MLGNRQGSASSEQMRPAVELKLDYGKAGGSYPGARRRVQAPWAGNCRGWIGGVELCSNCKSLACLDVPVLAYRR